MALTEELTEELKAEAYTFCIMLSWSKKLRISTLGTGDSIEVQWAVLSDKLLGVALLEKAVKNIKLAIRKARILSKSPHR